MSGIIGGVGTQPGSGVIKKYGQYIRGAWAMYDGIGDQGTDWHLIASALGSGNWPNYNENFAEGGSDHGTYPTSAPYTTVNMYKKWDDHRDANKIMFTTGDYSRWFITGYAHLRVSRSSPTNANFKYIACSNNLGSNSEGNIVSRYSSNNEDPWIDANSSHIGSHIFWGENNNSNYIGNIKNTYGGIFVYIK